MSSQNAPRHTQGDELIAALRANTASNVALATALGAVLLALNRNNELMEEDVCEGCGDEDCDGDCEPEPSPRRKR